MFVMAQLTWGQLLLKYFLKKIALLKYHVKLLSSNDLMHCALLNGLVWKKIDYILFWFMLSWTNEELWFGLNAQLGNAKLFEFCRLWTDSMCLLKLFFCEKLLL